jgi:hypothetical protein
MELAGTVRVSCACRIECDAPDFAKPSHNEIY